MKICVINASNPKRVGFRAPEAYGNENVDEIKAELKAKFPLIHFEFFTTTDEYEAVDFVKNTVKMMSSEVVYEDEKVTTLATQDSVAAPVWEEEVEQFDGIVINVAGYSHHSSAIKEAVADIVAKIPVIEVHASNIYAREIFRRNSVISEVASGVIAGFGVKSYNLAVSALIDMVMEKKEIELKEEGGEEAAEAVYQEPVVIIEEEVVPDVFEQAQVEYNYTEPVYYKDEGTEEYYEQSYDEPVYQEPVAEEQPVAEAWDTPAEEQPAAEWDYTESAQVQYEEQYVEQYAEPADTWNFDNQAELEPEQDVIVQDFSQVFEEEVVAEPWAEQPQEPEFVFVDDMPAQNNAWDDVPPTNPWEQ